MARSSTRVIVALVGCLLVASHTAWAQTTTAPAKPDELRYNGNNGNTYNNPNQPTGGADTTIISDDFRPPSNGQQGNPSNLEDMPTFFDDPSEQQQPNARPSDALWPVPMPNFGLDFGNGGPSPFGVMPPSRPQSLWHSLFGGDRLFDALNRRTRHFERVFEKQFRDLESQAGAGQDVSYFKRNGIAYVRTCSTKRVDSGADESGVVTGVPPTGVPPTTVPALLVVSTPTGEAASPASVGPNSPARS